jgi:hypothetical protein
MKPNDDSVCSNPLAVVATVLEVLALLIIFPILSLDREWKSIQGDSLGARVALMGISGESVCLISGMALFCFAGMVSAIVALCLPRRSRPLTIVALCMGIVAAVFIAWQIIVG